MTQNASVTSPRARFAPSFLLLGILAAALIAPSAAPAEAISSLYTSLDLAQCRDAKPEEMKDYGSVSICPGQDGIDVRVAEGDLRMFVSYGPDAAKQTAAYETIPRFNAIGETLEWRGARQGMAWKPFATILRFR